MAYGSDITEGLPYSLSNPVENKTYNIDGAAYDISINGLPFYIFASDTDPYSRKTAQYRKNQVDQSNEPGEQTLTGWWIRSQSSFHQGTGIKYYDPSVGETVQYRFAESKGVNVWTKGRVSLLRSCSAGHPVTGALATNERPQQFTRSIKWGSTNGVLMLDEYDVDKIDSSGTVTHFIDYNAGSGVFPVYSICDDGTTAYWVTNVTSGTAKLTVFKKPLTGSSASTADETQMFQVNGTQISNGIMEFVKERIVACFDNKVYEFTGAATTLPTAIYTHPSSTHVFTSITASGPAIYISGYNGIQSTIHKFTLSTAGAMPTLTSAVVAAELPVGEKVFKIFYYLGYMVIGTNKGIRVAAVSDQDGSINYGPLIVETTQPCYDFAAKDKYVWCATGVDGEPGLIRIDLGTEIEPLRFAYANDVYYPDGTTKQTTSCAFAGTTDQIIFTTAYSGSNGAVYTESASTLMSSGYVTTGRIRFSTLEGKVFKFFTPRIDDDNGRVTIESVDSFGYKYTIGDFAEDSVVSDVSISYPVGAQEYLSFKMTLNRSSSNTALGAVLSGYQIKALPAIPRQRLIQYPLACFDNEKDKFNVQMGYENSSYDRLSDLEALENQGDTIRVDDFRTGESYTGIIEEVQFINRTPPDKRFSGVGGILYVTIRSL